MISRLKSRRNEGRPAAPVTEWQAPPELQRSTPRPVRLTGGGKVAVAAALALAAGSVVSGVLLYVAASRGEARNARFAREGIAAEARVVRVGRVGRTRSNHPRRVLNYTYTAAGHEYEGRVTLREGDRRRFEPGSPLTILYLRSEPETSAVRARLGGVPVWTVAVAPPPLALAALLISCAIRKQRRLLAEGRVARGRITQTRRVYANNHRAYRVKYEFTILSGATRTGRYEANKQPLPEGSALTIVYDPDEPKRSAPYPFSLVRVSTL